MRKEKKRKGERRRVREGKKEGRMMDGWMDDG